MDGSFAECSVDADGGDDDDGDDDASFSLVEAPLRRRAASSSRETKRSFASRKGWKDAFGA